MLFSALHMPIERLTVQSHNFLYHYHQGLLRHGNLQMLSTEGGEHTHQDVKDVGGLRRSNPSWKRPIGLVALLQAQALKLALWAEEPEGAQSDITEVHICVVVAWCCRTPICHLS